MLSKSRVISLLKLFLGLGIVYFLFQSGRIDLSYLQVVAQDSRLIIVSVAFWFIFFVGLGALRWYLILRELGFMLPLWQCTKLQSIGLFFNNAMPGALGGDLVKVYYALVSLKTSPSNGVDLNGPVDTVGGRRTAVIMSIFLDRLIGFISIFFIGSVFSVLAFSRLWTIPKLFPILIALYLCTALSFFAAVVVSIPKVRASIKIWFENQSSVFESRLIGQTFKKVVSCLSVVSKNPRFVVNCFLLSVLIQLGNLSYFVFLSWFLDAGLQSWGDVFLLSSVFPIGVFLIAMPIAPAGIGVGHFAFDVLFRVVSLKNGANIFNVYFLVNVFMSLTGLLPYLSFKRNFDKPKDLSQAGLS